MGTINFVFLSHKGTINFVFRLQRYKKYFKSTTFPHKKNFHLFY